MSIKRVPIGFKVKPMLTNDLWGAVTFNWGQFHDKMIMTLNCIFFFLITHLKSICQNQASISPMLSVVSDQDQPVLAHCSIFTGMCSASYHVMMTKICGAKSMALLGHKASLINWVTLNWKSASYNWFEDPTRQEKCCHHYLKMSWHMMPREKHQSID